MISLTTIATDLQGLTAAELEKVQLAVNAEVGVRIQNERLARRIEKAVGDAQAVGFNDTEITKIIDAAQIKARTGKADPAFDPKVVPEPAKRGPSAGTKPA
jgi:hypothetical protein